MIDASNVPRLLRLAAVALALSLGSRAAAQTEDENRGYSGNRADTARVADGAARSPFADATLPTVRLTPPVTRVAGLNQHKLSLDGEWFFRHDVPADFAGTVDAESQWQTLRVPGMFWLQTDLRMHKELGVPVAWARRFDVPSEWDGRRVVMRFGSLDGKSKVWVNGRVVGENDGGYLPVEFDVTDALRLGESNTVALTIEKSLLTAWQRREMGNIGRSVYLQALPDVCVTSFHVDTDLDENFKNATLFGRVAVRNDSDEDVNNATLTLDAAGQSTTAQVGPLAAGVEKEIVVRLPLESPKLWHPETPNLHDATLTLSRGDDGELMAATRRFGVREVTTDGGVLKINGVPFTLKGSDFHTTYPGEGHQPSPENLRADVELLARTNHNAVRPWPTMDAAWADACDEWGVTTTIEVPILGMIYGTGPGEGGRGNDPALDAPYQELAARTVEAYWSHPSVILWGLANECPYYDYFQKAAFGIQNRDPSRPVFFGSDQRVGIAIPGTDVNDDHYPLGGYLDENVPRKIVGGDWNFPTDEPNIFSEWCHVHWNNATEQNFDPGIFDYWTHFVEAHMDYTRAVPHVAGGYLFGAMPLRGIDRHFDFGYWDERRRPNDTAFHVYQSFSPLEIFDARPTDDDDGQMLLVTNRSDTLDVSDFEVFATLQSGARESVKLLAKGGPGWTVPVLPPTTKKVEFVDSRGVVVQSFEPRPEPHDFERSFNGELTLEERDGTRTIRGDGFAWTIKSDGTLTASVGDEPAVTGGPELVVRESGLVGWPNNNGPVGNALADFTADKVEVRREGDKIVAHVGGAYDNAEGRHRLSFAADGTLDVHYDFEWTGENGVDALDAGVALTLPADFDTLRWNRQGEWKSYPADHIGRPVGEAPRMGNVDTLDARLAARPDAPRRYNDRKTWPWSQDLLGEGDAASTRDFRSTKFQVKHAALVAESGAGLLIDGGGSLHAHAFPNADGTITFQASTHHNGGTEFHLVKSVRKDVMIVQKGDRVRGWATFRLLPPEGASR